MQSPYELLGKEDGQSGRSLAYSACQANKHDNVYGKSTDEVEPQRKIRSCAPEEMVHTETGRQTRAFQEHTAHYLRLKQVQIAHKEFHVPLFLAESSDNLQSFQESSESAEEWRSMVVLSAEAVASEPYRVCVKNQRTDAASLASSGRMGSRRRRIVLRRPQRK